MKTKINSGIIVVIMAAVICAVGYADVRKDNVDMYIVLDKSLSMVEEIEDVKSYVINELVKDTLIPGDTLKIIAFYGSADRMISSDIDNISQSSVIDKIKTIKADGAYTDIGNALDSLKDWLEAQPSSTGPDGAKRRKYLLLLTDGKQEAPPGSLYHVDDMSIGSVNHAYLENVKEIKRKGWSIHIIGIGRESDAKEIAESLSASYEIVDTGDSDIAAGDGTAGGSGQGEGGSFSTRQILAHGVVSEESIKITSLKAKGGKISFEVSAENVDRPIDINVSDIVFDSDAGSTSLLKNQVLFSLDSNETKTVEFPIDKGDLVPGKYSGTMSFLFDSPYSFVEASFPAEIKVNSFLQNNIIWIIIVCLLLAGIIIFIITSIRNAAARKDDDVKEKVDLMKTIIK